MGVLQAGRWFGFDTAAIDASIGATSAVDLERANRTPATYVAHTDDCALLTVSREALTACVVGEAVVSTLKTFFNEDDADASDASDIDSEDAFDRAADVASPCEGGGGVMGVAAAASAAAATRAAEQLTPQATLVAAGAAHAVLHCAMGAHPLDAAVQLACLRFVRAIASPPCGESTLKELGAMGALDRVAVAHTMAETGRFQAEMGTQGNAGEAVAREAAAAMRALVEGCEQNMRHALSLGCGDIVW